MVEVRKDLAGSKPYRVPKPKAKILLDSNESPWNLPPDIIKDIERKLDSLMHNRYPDISAEKLRGIIGEGYGLKGDNVLVANGSNEVILYLMLAFGGTERTALVFEPTYAMHSVICRISATSVQTAQRMPDFSIDEDNLFHEISSGQPDVIFFCSPNNPTGNTIPSLEIEEVVSATDSLIIIDEAYGEFTGDSLAFLVKKYPNVAVVKTFSKAFRMAALRVGYLLASEQIIDGLARVKLPYNLNAFSQVAAEVVFLKRGKLLEANLAIAEERDRVYLELTKVQELKVYPSQANFILFRTEKDAGEVCDEVLKQGILLRNFSHREGLQNCLRVTIGTKDENDAFLAALKKVL